MDPETAEFWLNAITACGFVFWIGSAFITWRVARASRTEDDITPQHEESTVLEGSPEELAGCAAHALALSTLFGPQLQSNVLERTQDVVVFEVTPRWGKSPLLERGVLGFGRRSEGQSEARWQLYFGRGGALLLLARLFVGLGFGVLVALHVVLRIYALPAPEPYTRMQVLQMVHCIHFVWPPVLFAGLLAGQRRWIRLGVGRLVRQLPHLRAPAARS